jgi:hypothetical protein
MGELLLARSLKVAAVVLGAVVLNRLVRWLLRRLVRGLEHRYIQQRLESLLAKTPRPLLASTDPLPSLRRSQRAEMIGAALANVASVAIWLVAAIGVLQVLGLRLGPLLAGAGIAGLVLSLSPQQMVRDFLSGMAMLMEDQYGPGDVVDAGPAKGVVERPQPEGEPRGCGGGGWGLASRRGRRRGCELAGVGRLRFFAGRLVDEDGDAVTDRLGVRESQGLLGVGVAEEALAGPEDHREDHQAQLVDQVVVEQRLHEPGAAVDHDVPIDPLSQLGGLLHHVAPEHRGVVPLGVLQG